MLADLTADNEYNTGSCSCAVGRLRVCLISDSDIADEIESACLIGAKVLGFLASASDKFHLQ